MIISQAHREFQIRRYLWAQLKAATEIKEEFPHFWLFKGGPAWRYYHFLKMLDKSAQKNFVSASLRRHYRYAAADLGETTSIDEKAIEDRFFKYNLVPEAIEKEIIVRRRMGEPIKFASKRRVQKAMIASFQKAFGGQGSQAMQLPGYPVPLLRMKISGWIVQTNFHFGRSRSLISYDHLIASEERICHPTTPGVTGPALVLDCLICWIGMANMEWDYLTDEDVEPACDSVVTLCREFFDELPKLIRGLERERVSACETSR